MTLEEAIQRKFTAGFSDLQVLTLFSLAKHELLTLSDLAESLRVGPSAAWHAAVRLTEHGLVYKDSINKGFRTTFYFLTEDGKGKVAWLMGKD